MDFQFKGDSSESESIDMENEYTLEIKLGSFTLTKHKPSDIQLIFIFGDLVDKMTVDEGEGFEEKNQSYCIHSVPSKLSEKIKTMPLMLYILSLTDLKPLGSMLLEVNECFANAIKCHDFRSESIKKSYNLNDGKDDLGKITLIFSVSKNIGNSNRHRRFYSESTSEKMKMQIPK